MITSTIPEKSVLVKPPPLVRQGSSFYSPGAREIVQTVVNIWKDDKSTEHLSYAKLLALLKQQNPGWGLSEKRLKASLKEFNLEPNPQLYTYVNKTVSTVSPELEKMLPKGIKVSVTKTRGKALYATKNFKAGDVLWTEEPLVLAPKAEFLRIRRTGSACSYCAKALRQIDGQLIAATGGVPCKKCTGNWCSTACQKRDLLHEDMYHNSIRNRLNYLQWIEFEKFCMDNNWRAGYLFGLVVLRKARKDAKKSFIPLIDSMAKVRQDVRQKAVSDEGSLEFEQHETMWKEGFKLLYRSVKSVYSLTYDEFQEGIGMVNINNVHNCIFAIHSHLNHSCQPNAEVETITLAEGIRIKALTDIAAGQEVTVTYVDPESSYDDRRYKLRINWGFICHCPRCKKDATKPVKVPDQSPVQARERSRSVRFDSNPVSEIQNNQA